MNSPTVSIPIRDLEEIVNRADRCAQDLDYEIQQNHPGDSDTMLRRRIQMTEDVRWLQSAIPAFCVKYGLEKDCD